MMRLESPGRIPQTFLNPAGLSRRIALTSFALFVLMRSSGWVGALACSRTPQTSWGVHLPLEGLGTHSSAREPTLPWGLSPQHGGLGRVGALGLKVRSPHRMGGSGERLMRAGRRRTRLLPVKTPATGTFHSPGVAEAEGERAGGLPAGLLSLHHVPAPGTQPSPSAASSLHPTSGNNSSSLPFTWAPHWAQVFIKPLLLNPP